MTSRALAYVRVSKAREEMVSPELQLIAIEDWCARNRAVIVDVVYDLDETGRNFARAGVQQVLDRTINGEADLIVVWKWSRFGRNIRDALINLDRVEQVGARLVAATEDFDTSTSVGRFGRGQFLLMAQFESDRIGDQWKETHNRRAKAGLAHSGYPRFGYIYTRENGYQPNPETAPALAEMYRLYIAGHTFSEIARIMNANGVPTVKPSRGWWSQSVRHTMESGTAAGLLRWRGEIIQGAHPPIIDMDTWEQYQALRRLNALVSPRIRRPTNPYAGILKCGGCGGPVGRSSNKISNLVNCTHHRNHMVVCPSPGSIKLNAVDAVVTEFLGTVAAEINKRTVNKPQRRIMRDNQKHVARLDASLARLTRQYADGDIPRETYIATRDQIVTERDAAQHAADQSAWRMAAPVLPPDLLNEWETLDILGQREILRALITTITVYKSGIQPRVVITPTWESGPPN